MSPISAKTLRARELPAIAKQKAKNQPTIDHETLQEIWYLLGGDAFNLSPLTPAQVLDRVREFKQSVDELITQDEADEQVREALDCCAECKEKQDYNDDITNQLESAVEENNKLTDALGVLIDNVREELTDLQERGDEPELLDAMHSAIEGHLKKAYEAL